MAPEEPTKRNVKVLATPAVRRIAQEYGVSLGDVRGSGKEGRVLKEDILAHVEGASPAPAPAFVPPVVSRPMAPAPQQVESETATLFWSKSHLYPSHSPSHPGSCSSCSPSPTPSSCTCYRRWTPSIGTTLLNIRLCREGPSGEDQCYCEGHDQNYGRSPQDSPFRLQR